MNYVSYTNLELVNRQLESRFYLDDSIDLAYARNAILEAPGFFEPVIDADDLSSISLNSTSLHFTPFRLRPQYMDSWAGWISLIQPRDYPWIKPNSKFYELWIHSLVEEFPEITDILPIIRFDAQNGSGHQTIIRDLMCYQNTFRLEKNLANKTIIFASQSIVPEEFQSRESASTYARLSNYNNHRFLKKSHDKRLPFWRNSRVTIRYSLYKSLYRFLQNSYLLILARPVWNVVLKCVKRLRKSR